MKNLLNDLLLKLVISFKLNPIITTVGVLESGWFTYEVLKIFIG